MNRITFIVSLIIMPLFVNAQDAFKQYQLGNVSFSVSVDMRKRDAGPSVVTFVSDADREGAILTIRRAENEGTLRQLFDNMQKKNESCIDTSGNDLHNNERIQYYVSEMTCQTRGDRASYRYMAAIQTSTARYTISAECPLTLRDKYRPVFRRAVNSFSE